MRPIVWLASYPKCGNTWFRLMLANLGRDEPADINSIATDDGIATARRRFDESFLFASGLLTHDECDRLRPLLYRDVHDRSNAAGGSDPLARFRLIKTHDAWLRTTEGTALLGGGEISCGAVLIVRDPRDVAASLANHLHIGLDKAIDFMGRIDSDLSGTRHRQHQQLRQRLLGWSGYYASWLEQDEVPVHLLRYEDMQEDPAGALAGGLDFLKIAVPSSFVEQAVRFSSFSQLQAQEERQGFQEAPVRMGEGRFFRNGIAGGWRHELTDGQVAEIELAHAPMMQRLGYDTVSRPSGLLDIA